MNDKQAEPVELAAEAAEMRELGASELLAVAGGPQITNDQNPP